MVRPKFSLICNRSFIISYAMDKILVFSESFEVPSTNNWLLMCPKFYHLISSSYKGIPLCLIIYMLKFSSVFMIYSAWMGLLQKNKIIKLACIKVF